METAHFNPVFLMELAPIRKAWQLGISTETVHWTLWQGARTMSACYSVMAMGASSRLLPTLLATELSEWQSLISMETGSPISRGQAITTAIWQSSWAMEMELFELPFTILSAMALVTR